ncbi:hypothetical protein ACRALDRAFT_208967 [Sodiomyces alcalophilus JCM 7366]|uniref:uncharacterized protein n=1 Tax=Sodiomyces alcalophilus JCM 7366 TaxID=591952 RepID=UPI0039B65E2F
MYVHEFGPNLSRVSETFRFLQLRSFSSLALRDYYNYQPLSSWDREETSLCKDALRFAQKPIRDVCTEYLRKKSQS